MSRLRRLARRFFDIRRDEWPRAIGLSLYFFLVIAIFWILKPVKRGLILAHFGADPLRLLGWEMTPAQAEQLGKVINVFAAYAAVVAFTWLVRRVSRRRLVLLSCGFFAARCSSRSRSSSATRARRRSGASTRWATSSTRSWSPRSARSRTT